MRRSTAAVVLGLYWLIGIAAPVAHAQAESGKRAGIHVEAEDASCSQHDELSCRICRVLTTPERVAASTPSILVSFPETALVPTQQRVAQSNVVFSPLGARAPPLR
jgi:hypothetical protein